MKSPLHPYLPPLKKMGAPFQVGSCPPLPSRLCAPSNGIFGAKPSGGAQELLKKVVFDDWYICNVWVYLNGICNMGYRYTYI